MMILNKWQNSFIWCINGTLTSTINLGQSGPGSNGIKELLSISERSRPESHYSMQFSAIPKTFFSKEPYPSVEI